MALTQRSLKILFHYNEGTGVPGVYFNKRYDNWTAVAMINSKGVHLGCYETKL